MSRIPVRWHAYALGCLAGSLLGATSAAALSIGFSASDGTFVPTTAVGTLDLDLSLAELIASDTAGFLVPLGVAVTAQATLTDASGVHSNSYTRDPWFSTSTEQLLLQVELLAGNPARVELVVFDSAGWRSCIGDPATCERRVLSVTVPGGGFGPGVAMGQTFDSAWFGAGYQVDFSVPEPGTDLLWALGAGALAAQRRTRGVSA